MKLSIKRSVVIGLNVVLLAMGVSAFASSGSYVINGKRYYPLNHVQAGFTQVGEASWYDVPTNFGVQTASGERLNDKDMTAASPILPLGTRVKVINLANNKTVVVRINDRGPYKYRRIIDLTRAAAKVIGYEDEGKAQVKVVVL